MNTRAVGLATALAMTLGNPVVVRTAASLALITAAASPPPVFGVEIPGQNPAHLGVAAVPDLDGNDHLATLLAGPYLQVGSHQLRIPSRTFSTGNGRILLEPETLQALNFLPRD